MTRRRRLLIVALVALAALAAHHAVKAWITHTLRRLP
jgi:Flp pilus assembly pilin Flp